MLRLLAWHPQSRRRSAARDEALERAFAALGPPIAARANRLDSPAVEFETRAIHAGQDPDPHTGAVTVPIYATSTYAHTGCR